MENFLKLLFVFLISCCINLSYSQAIDYRPAFHFTPQKNWMNDPNGLVYYKGEYHLFYQYNPYGNRWGHMSWAHAVSKDLFHWKDLPIALYEEKCKGSNDSIMIFSGSAVVDLQNTSGFAKKDSISMVAIYTSHVHNGTKEIEQHQSIAYSIDGGIMWTKYANHPVLRIHSPAFRDPKVFWYAPQNKWMMVVSKPDEFKVRFYSSKNLKDWIYLSEFGGIGDTGRVWECPDLYQLHVTNKPGEKKWVLSLSSGNVQKGFGGMQYFIGDFDGHSFKALPYTYPEYVDSGKDFFAGITYNNIPANDGRTIMIGWADDWEYGQDAPTQRYRGMFSVPRNLSLKSFSGVYRLMQQPVKEITQLRYDKYDEQNVELNNSSKKLNITGNSLDIQFKISLKDAQMAGIRLLKSGDEETVIYFNKESNSINLDRTHSGNVSFHPEFSSIESAPLNERSDEINLHILVDKSIIEVFVNNGEYALTDNVYPTKTENSIEVFSKSGAAVFKDMTVWKLRASMRNR